STEFRLRSIDAAEPQRVSGEGRDVDGGYEAGRPLVDESARDRPRVRGPRSRPGARRDARARRRARAEGGGAAGAARAPERAPRGCPESGARTSAATDNALGGRCILAGDRREDERGRELRLQLPQPNVQRRIRRVRERRKQ